MKNIKFVKLDYIDRYKGDIQPLHFIGCIVVEFLMQILTVMEAYQNMIQEN